VVETSHSVRGRFVPHNSSTEIRKPGPETERPGVFQLTLLRAFGLSKAYRDVFLLKEIQGCTLAEIAATLGISIDTALVRLKRARREIGHWDDSDATEGAR
jgi:DNA-directed RNA polymerase specialized sigma24 family protein